MAGNKESIPGVEDPERELTCVMLKTVVTLLKGSVRNAGKDGTKFVLSLLDKTNYFRWFMSMFKGYIQGLTHTDVWLLSICCDVQWVSLNW